MSSSSRSTELQRSDNSSPFLPIQASSQEHIPQTSTSPFPHIQGQPISNHNPSSDWPNFGTVPVSREQDTEARSSTLVSADRKRRLTDSTHGPLRRRTNSGGFLTQDARLNAGPSSTDVEGPSSRLGHSTLMRNMNHVRQVTMDETTQQATQSRPSGSSRDEYTLPQWQPDSEVSKCPICDSQFTWYFRKHHCRKCGRVVCANCSPHRITIPCQFIVHPPEPNLRHSASPVSNQSTTVDLPDSAGTSMRRHGIGIPASTPLGGGEEVRLCNPCVPDPQPQPESGYSSSTRTGRIPPWPHGSDFRSSWETYQRQRGLPRYDQTTAWLAEQARQELRRQRGRGMVFPPDNPTGDIARMRPSEIPEENLPGYGGFGVAVPALQRRSNPPAYRDDSRGTRPPNYSSSEGQTVHGHQFYRNSMPGPGYVSARHPHYPDASRRLPAFPESNGNRPRVHSMLEVSPSYPSDSTDNSRPRLDERDICPICRHALPPVGASGDETDREQHIMDCIASRDPTYMAESPARNSTGPSSPNQRRSFTYAQLPPVYMLRFSATEKDCTSEDGSAQECSICMVEYEVGEKLARLECLCKFHEECIAGWFRRKRECPVHKRDEREAI